jgi:cell division topological specificity factor
MSILSFFHFKKAEAPPPPPAAQAKDRLKIVLAHERACTSAPDYLLKIQAEILQVIAKYVEFDQDKLQLKVENEEQISRLEVNIELPRSSPLGSNAERSKDMAAVG